MDFNDVKRNFVDSYRTDKKLINNDVCIVEYSNKLSRWFACYFAFEIGKVKAEELKQLLMLSHKIVYKFDYALSLCEACEKILICGWTTIDVPSFKEMTKTMCEVETMLLRQNYEKLICCEEEDEDD